MFAMYVPRPSEILQSSLIFLVIFTVLGAIVAWLTGAPTRSLLSQLLCLVAWLVFVVFLCALSLDDITRAAKFHDEPAAEYAVRLVLPHVLSLALIAVLLFRRAFRGWSKSLIS
jgi:uncharacterized membrane protein